MAKHGIHDRRRAVYTGLGPDPKPIAFTHHARRGEPEPTYKAENGPLRFTLPDGHVIEVEAYVRPGNPIGLLVRGIDCMLDIEPQVANTVIVKPRDPLDGR